MLNKRERDDPGAGGDPGRSGTGDRHASDAIDILDATGNPIMVVDHHFALTRFNRGAAETFHLSPSDVGRSLRDCPGLRDVQQLRELCSQAIAAKVPYERQIRIDDRWFVLRASPYPVREQAPGVVVTLSNVTALRASIDQAIVERQYTKAIFNALTEPLVVVDAELRVQTANGAFHSMFQVSRDRMQGLPLRSIVAFDRAGPELWLSLRTLASGEAKFQRVELEVDLPSFGPRCFELNACTLSSGGAVLLLVTFHDITDRLRGQKTSAMLAAIVESSHDAIVSMNLDGVVITWNRGAERLFGYSDAEMIGQPIEVVIPVDRRPEEAHILEAVRRGEHIRLYETVRRHRNGSLRDVSLMVSPIVDAQGRVVGASKIATDISARKTLETSLRDALENSQRDVARLEILQEVGSALGKTASLQDALDKCLDAAIALTNAERGNVQLVSQGNLEIATQRGFERPFLEYFDKVHDGEAACGQALGRGQRAIVDDVETDRLLSNTPARRVLLEAGVRAVQSTPLLTSAGTVVGMLSTHFGDPHTPSARDLQALDVLARQAADFVERLRAEASLRAADRHKDEFLATLAHELRNPLAAIGNVVQILRMKDSSPSQLRWATDVIGRQLQHLVRLVDDLLDVSRIATGKIALQRARTPVKAIVSTGLETTRPLIEDRAQQLAVLLPDEELFVDGDLIRLSQVVANLVHNAAKYTQSAGHIAVSVVPENGQAVIRVRDNGTGIRSDMLSRIFDMFEQVDRSLERSEGGLGIGLTLVRLLVGLHGGSVEAASDGLGKGSEFTVRLPLSAAVPGMENAESLAPAPRRSCLRILVADDNCDSAQSMRMLLSDAGNEVLTVEDGERVLECAGHFNPDVVLLDIGMPKRNGYDVAQLLRSGPLGKDLLLIAMTGWGSEEARSRSRAAGFDHHLVKPVDFQKLQSLLAGGR